MTETKMNTRQVIQEKKWEIFAVSLAIVVLSISTFTSVYSNSWQNREMAKINYDFYERKAAIASGTEAIIYRDTADSWQKQSEALKDIIESRARSVNYSFYSLVFLIPTFISLLQGKKRCWITFLAISLMLLFFAASIYTFRSQDWSFVDILPLKLVALPQ